jgi:putative SOS response-associated peptidase YedK
MTTTHEAVRRLFKVADNRSARLDPLPAIFPGYQAPIVRRAADGERELVTMSWGFALPQQGKAAKRVTNVRDDKVRISPFWRGSFEQRRCLVPVTSFSEPKGNSPAVWHWFGPDETRPLFAFAGLWRSFRGRLRPVAVRANRWAK